MLRKMRHLLLACLLLGAQLLLAQAPATIVKDIAPGASDGYTSNIGTVQLGSTVYFVGSTGNLWNYLWKTDGTAAGTVQVHPDLYDVREIQALGDKILFWGLLNGYGLFATDGTANGTVKLAGFSSTNFYLLSPNLGDKALFVAKVSGESQLWVTDGTVGGTFSLGAYDLVDGTLWPSLFQGKLIINDQSNINNHRPTVISDGTEAGTALFDSTLLDLTGLSSIYSVAGAGDLMFVSGKFVFPNGSSNGKTYVTDGTMAGTHEINTFGHVRQAKKVGDLYYLNYGEDYYVYHSANGALVQILDQEASFFARPFEYKNKVYIAGNEGDLYETDGTVAGTQIISTKGAGQNNYTVRIWGFNDVVYYTFRDQVEGVGIYRIDLTTGEESLLVKMEDYTGVLHYPNLHVVDCKMLFPKKTASQGIEWWTTPHVPFVPNIVNNGPNILCSGETITLEVTNACTGCSVTWSNGQTGPILTVTQAGTYSATQANSCGSSQQSFNYQILNGSPSFPPNVEADGPTAICPGQSVTLNVDNFFQCPACTIEWSNGQTGTSLEVTEPGIYTASFYSDCGLVGTSNEISVTPGSPPSAPAIVANGTTVLCPGELVALSIAEVCSGCTIMWSNGLSDSTIYVAQVGDYTATLSNGCGESGSSDVVSVVSGTDPDNPVVEAGGPTTICSGQELNLSVANACLGCTVHWSNGLTGESIGVSETGIYTATMSNVCGNSGVSNEIAVEVSVYIPAFQVAMCTFTAPEGSNYQWYLNGQPIEGASGQTYVAVANGNYSLMMTNPEGCTGLSTEVAANCFSGTDDEQPLAGVSLSPNPARQTLSITIQSLVQAPCSIDIWNAYGQVVLRDVAKVHSGEMIQASLDVTSLPAGSYYCVVRNTENGKVLSKRFEVL